MAGALYIANLPSDFDDSQMQTIFGPYGTIKQGKVLPANGQGKVAAIINFESQEEANWIVENLNGNIPQGLSETIIVKHKDGGAAGGKGGDAGGWGAGGKGGGGDSWSGGGKGGPYDGGKGGGKAGMAKILVDGLLNSGAMPGGQKYQNDNCTLYVGNLPYDMTDLDLYMIFSPFGSLAPKGVRAMKGDDTPCKGFGFINFLDDTAANNAVMTLNGTQMPDGRVLKVMIKQAGGGKGGAKGVN